MRYQYKVKNFRIFDEDGVKLDMAPITILTGSNSSGKSSLVKSMLLVNEALGKLAHAGELSSDIRIDFTTAPNNLLGTFDNVIHRGSVNKDITIEYTIPSLLLNENVVVSITLKKHCKLNGGIMSGITISRPDGTILFQCDSGEFSYNHGERSLGAAPLLYQDLREPFFKYVFATKYRGFINGDLEKYAKGNANEEVAKLVNETSNTIHSYYISNKEWIENILSISVPSRSSLSSFDSPKTHIGISSEQLFSGNLLYYKILDPLYATNKGEFKKVAKLIANNGKDCTYFEAATKYIESVAEKFSKSEYNTFSDYCCHLLDKYFQCTDVDGITVSEMENSYYLDVLIKSGIFADQLSDMCGHNDLDDLNNLLKLLAGLAESKKISDIYRAESQSWKSAYHEYVGLVVKEILSYRIPTEISYIPTSLVKIKRLYSFDEKDEMTTLLKDFILTEPNYNEGSWKFASRWLKKLNIGERISVKALADGTGCEVRIHQENDETGQLLADFGYGISQLLFLLIRIDIEGNRRLPIVDGLTHIDYEEPEDRNQRILYEKPLTIVLEEPEVHLHPKFQSIIADILLDAYTTFNFHFIVETHSEYLIRKTQVLVAQMGFENNVESVEKSPFITYYIPETSKPYSLGYRKDGKFMESFGSGFYDEASKLAFNLL